MPNDLVTITRATVKRGWTEFEPKVITGLLSGSIGAAIISLLPSFGVDVTESMRNFIIVGCYFIGSYLTPSSGMVVTTTNNNGDVETKTTGHAVVTATGSIPVQAASTADPSAAASNWVARAAQTRAENHDGATQVIPPAVDLL